MSMALRAASTYQKIAIGISANPHSRRWMNAAAELLCSDHISMHALANELGGGLFCNLIKDITAMLRFSHGLCEIRPAHLLQRAQAAVRKTYKCFAFDSHKCLKNGWNAYSKTTTGWDTDGQTTPTPHLDGQSSAEPPVVRTIHYITYPTKRNTSETCGKPSKIAPTGNLCFCNSEGGP